MNVREHTVSRARDFTTHRTMANIHLLGWFVNFVLNLIAEATSFDHRMVSDRIRSLCRNLSRLTVIFSLNMMSLFAAPFGSLGKSNKAKYRHHRMGDHARHLVTRYCQRYEHERVERQENAQD